MPIKLVPPMEQCTGQEAPHVSRAHVHSLEEQIGPRKSDSRLGTDAQTFG